MYSLHSFVTFVVCVNLQLPISEIEAAKWWLFALQSKVDQNIPVSGILMLCNKIPNSTLFLDFLDVLDFLDFQCSNSHFLLPSE